MRLLISILFTFLSIHHHQKSKFDLFQSEAKSPSSPARVIKTKRGNFSITKPVVEGELKLHVIDNLISKEIRKEYCDNKNCKVNLELGITHNSGKLLCLKETVNTMFRFPRDVKVYIFFNYLISGNEIFQLKLKNTKHFRDRLKYQIEHIKNSECGNWLNNDTQISLLVDKGVTYINLYNDEVCSTNIKFNLKNTDLEFQRVKNL